MLTLSELPVAAPSYVMYPLIVRSTVATDRKLGPWRKGTSPEFHPGTPHLVLTLFPFYIIAVRGSLLGNSSPEPFPIFLASVPHFSLSLQLLLWYLSFLNTRCGEQAGHSRGRKRKRGHREVR